MNFDDKDKSTESPSDRAERIISKRPKNKQSETITGSLSMPIDTLRPMNFGSGNPTFSSTFKHIDAAEQIQDGSITTELLASGSITVDKIDIDADLSFNEYQALQLRLENVSTNPVAGNPGRLVWNTTLEGVYVDTGSIFESISSIGTVSDIFSDSNPELTGSIQFKSGTNISLVQSGNSITINASGTGSGSYQQDVFNIAIPTNIFVLTHTPISNSQVVFFNGLGLAQGGPEDYTISGNTITLNGGITLTSGDKILVTYSY